MTWGRCPTAAASRPTARKGVAAAHASGGGGEVAARTARRAAARQLSRRRGKGRDYPARARMAATSSSMAIQTDSPRSRLRMCLSVQGSSSSRACSSSGTHGRPGSGSSRRSYGSRRRAPGARPRRRPAWRERTPPRRGLRRPRRHCRQARLRPGPARRRRCQRSRRRQLRRSGARLRRRAGHRRCLLRTPASCAAPEPPKRGRSSWSRAYACMKTAPSGALRRT